MLTDVELSWHSYKYYPYEKQLAEREAMLLLKARAVEIGCQGVVARDVQSPRSADRLVYFSGSKVKVDGATSRSTQQARLEGAVGNGVKRQATRYSVHGMHEYKGKFNPQIAKAMLNILGAQPGSRVLDPFCGSGTTLVECEHLGVESVGCDVNPLAVYVANAKLESLGVPADKLLSAALQVLSVAKRSNKSPDSGSDREQYLRSWFPEKNFACIEKFHKAALRIERPTRDVLLVIASNLLRDYSLQEPGDLRIRRRKSPFPEASFWDAYEKAVRRFCDRLAATQGLVGVEKPRSVAKNLDCKKTDESSFRQADFDFAITSPPYAMALPYIDTQRLSLVWLGLLDPPQVMALETELVGSRETRGQKKKELLAWLVQNRQDLPEEQAAFCRELQEALGENDGFRRRMVPSLLYRYFGGMSDAFAAVHRLVRRNGLFGLVVGGNHTVLGGHRFDIDTPAHLVQLAVSNGWEHVETIPLQTYQRYELHSGNSTQTESLLVLRAS